MRRRWLALIALALLLPARGWSQSSSWIAWAREHHPPIATIAATPGDTFADLEFLREVLDQYDGVLFIDAVNPPTYVTVF